LPSLDFPVHSPARDFIFSNPADAGADPGAGPAKPDPQRIAVIKHAVAIDANVLTDGFLLFRFHALPGIRFPLRRGDPPDETEVASMEWGKYMHLTEIVGVFSLSEDGTALDCI
jgi:hypothetical protein